MCECGIIGQGVCRVQGAGCRVQGAGYRVQGAGYKVKVKIRVSLNIYVYDTVM